MKQKKQEMQRKLKNYRLLQREAERLEAKIREAERVRGYKNARRYQGWTEQQMEQLQASTSTRLEEAQRQRREIEEIIYAVEDLQCREILELKYIDGKTLQQIARELCYCERHAGRLHAKALEAAVQAAEAQQR